MKDEYVMTIDSDYDDADDQPPIQKIKPRGLDESLNPDFTFDLLGDPIHDVWEDGAKLQDLVKGSNKEPVSVDDIIQRRKVTATKRKREEEESEEEEALSEDGSEDPLATSDDDDESEPDSDGEASDSGASSSSETQLQKDRKAAFFADPSESSSSAIHSSFLSMNLSRPIMKALTSMSFAKPTPIQAATIPVALLGKDIVGSAVTGSGKTAAFMVPVLERLMYRERGRGASAIRCLVLVPTRELGVQCFDVGKRLAAHTDVRFALVVGGLSLKPQEVQLRTRPDVIIATPGRLIDHLRNSPSFAIDTLDILILDEADRMLSDGFADELKQIIEACPMKRQTMLFSATMTDSVDDLIKMSLNRPVRLFVDPKRTTSRALVQEFVRVKARSASAREGEAERPAILASLCKRTFKHRVIVFLRSKKLAHQIRVMFSLLDMKCDELHGDLTQEQRLKALQHFREGTVDYLLATDLASRGLDIKGVETVINYDMPGDLAQYLHRVGRTARAGKAGRSVTLVGEADRKLLKAVIKHSAGGADQIRHRTVPHELVQKWVQRLDDLKEDISDILEEEKEEKAMRHAEMEIKKTENMIEHKDEIYSRPARTWFQSEGEKKKAQGTSKEDDDTVAEPVKTKSKEPKKDKYAGLSRKVKRRKMALEDVEESGKKGELDAAVRSAKKAIRPTKIGEPLPRIGTGGKRGASRNGGGRKEGGKKAGSGGNGQGGKKRSGFDREFGVGGGGGREGMRAKKGDKVGKKQGFRR